MSPADGTCRVRRQILRAPRRTASARLLPRLAGALLLLLLLAVPAAAGLVDTIQYVAGQSGALARDAAAKILEKANEYGYDDIDILARFGMGLKYPEGIEVRKLDAALALIDVALVATDKGAGYFQFLFRNPFGQLVIRTIPYLTGRQSIADVLLHQMKSEARGYLDRYNLGKYLIPDDPALYGGVRPGLAALTGDLVLPKLELDVAAARRQVRDLQVGARYLTDSLSVELYGAIASFFPEVTFTLPAQLMDDIATGQILVSLVHLLRTYDREFARVNAVIGAPSRFIAAAAAAEVGETGFRILAGIPDSLAEVERLARFLRRVPAALPEIARYGRDYYRLVRDLAPAEFAALRPFSGSLHRIRTRHGRAGLAFVAAYGADGDQFLKGIAKPSSYIKRRVAMAAFLAGHGPGAARHFFALGLLYPAEPPLLALALLALLVLALYFHVTGAFVLTELATLPARQKVALGLILALALAAFYWTLVENAQLFLDVGPQGEVAFIRPPAIWLTPETLFSTHLTAIDSAEVEFAQLVAAGRSFRTAEVEVFEKTLANLRSKYVIQMESFEVRLVGQPKMVENYAKEKILSESDFLLEVTLGVRNLDVEPRLFPLVAELSTVLGNVVAPSQGVERLTKTTFNPGVADTFTLTFPIRLEDRPNRIVVRKEFLIRSTEKFIEFGPGSPLRIGDILAARWGLLFLAGVDDDRSGEILIHARALSAFDETRPVELFRTPGLDSGVFLVAVDGRTFALGATRSAAPGLPELPPNTLVPVDLVFRVDPALHLDRLSTLVVNKKKILLEPYARLAAIAATAEHYLRRIAAAAEFEIGRYYLDPPIYRKWAKDVDMARRHFERAQELLPDSELIRNAVNLTRP